MQTPKVIINKWKAVKEYGYIKELNAITGISRPALSRILAGKQATTPGVMLKIRQFLQEKEKVQKSLTEQDQD